jgi:hypothetical protein
MLRIRSALPTLAVVVGLTGCGSSSDPAPPAPAPPPAVAADTGGSTAPVAAHSSGAGSDIASGIEREHSGAVRSLRRWGRAADAECKRSARQLKRWESRIPAVPKGRRATSAELRHAGQTFVDLAHQGEAEYDALRGIPLPPEAEAVGVVESFFDKEEEALTLIQRIGVELKAHNDREAFVRTLDRLTRLTDDYKHDARAAHAPHCS